LTGTFYSAISPKIENQSFIERFRSIANAAELVILSGKYSKRHLNERFRSITNAAELGMFNSLFDGRKVIK
jgi:hypothetical protein